MRRSARLLAKKRQIGGEISLRSASPTVTLVQDPAILQETEVLLCVFSLWRVTVVPNVSGPA